MAWFGRAGARRRLRHGSRLALIFLALPLLLLATSKLYLKDGSYQLVREYKVEGDRVRFYSTERSQWEEIPLAIVDVKKTEAEIHAREEAEKADEKALAEEEHYERAQQREVERIPQDPGAYYIDGDKLTPVKVGESQYVNSKKRTILRVVSPLPILMGKGWVEMKGEHSPNLVKSATPEFYIRLSEDERFGIVKMTPAKGMRIVEKVTTVPKTDIVEEDPTMVDVFRQQVAEGVYKIWPMKPLEPGEYGVVEYTEGKMNMQVWDFSWPGAGKGA